MINLEQHKNIWLSEEQSEIYTEILDLMTKKGLSIRQAQELCIVCANNIEELGFDQKFLGDIRN